MKRLAKERLCQALVHGFRAPTRTVLDTSTATTSQQLRRRSRDTIVIAT